MNEEEDQERNRQEEHWRELARLLGIDPEQPGSRPAALKEPILPPVEAGTPLPRPETKPEPIHPVAQGHEDHQPEQPAEVWETPWEAPPHLAETQRELARPDAREGEKPRKGRRRKGHRGRNDERRPHPTEKEAPEPGSHEEEDREDFSASRSHSQEMPYPEDSENGVEEPEDAPEPVEARTEEDVDEDDTLRDWNVPSWNELIASLYRPDR